MTFWPALGNHDVGAKDGAAALAVFDVPLERPAGLAGRPQLQLRLRERPHRGHRQQRQRRGAARCRSAPGWRRTWPPRSSPGSFVFFHHPPFSSANHGENAKMRDVMVPFFTRARIDIVFAGHDHSYERTRPIDGVIYVVSGNAGARLYEHRNPHDYTARFYNERHGLSLVEIHGPRLLLRHVNADNKEVDRLEMNKPVAAAARPADAARPAGTVTRVAQHFSVGKQSQHSSLD